MYKTKGDILFVINTLKEKKCINILYRKIKKNLNTQQGAVNISLPPNNQRTDKKNRHCY